MNIQIIHYRLAGMVENLPGVPQDCDLAFIDPPYNFAVKYADDTTGDDLPMDRYLELCNSAIWTAAQHLRPGGTLWWLSPSAHMSFIPSLLERHVGPLLYRIVKQETFSQYQQHTLTDDYRMLYAVQKPGGPLAFHPDAIRQPSARQEVYKDKRADPRGRVPGQVWNIRRLQGTSVDHVDWHKAQLPPELLHRIISGWTNPGDKILELFAGSGNMAKMARGLGRSYYGIEGSATYVAKIKERLASEQQTI